MEPPCFQQKHSNQPVCGVHNVPLEQYPQGLNPSISLAIMHLTTP